MVIEHSTQPSKQFLASLFRSFSKEDVAWSIHYLTLQMETFEKEQVFPALPKPFWWNYPISESIQSIMPQKRIADTDYKEQLTQILADKYK